MESLHLQGLAIDGPLREGCGLPESDEKLLVARFVRGDRDAFDQIVSLHGPRVTRLAYRLLGWQGAQVEDVVQDVFLAALEHGHKFRGDNGLSQWLTAITLNRCRSHIRRRVLTLKWLRSRSPDEPVDASADIDSLRDETSAKVRGAVRALPPRDREVVVLYYLEDRSTSQISQILGVSENAIDVRLHRARKRLREILEGFVNEPKRATESRDARR